MTDENNLNSEKLAWEEDGIIKTVCVGGLGENTTEQFIDQFSALLDKAQGKGKALIDASRGGATKSSKIRKMYIEFGKRMKVDMVAVFGFNTFQKVVARFIINAINKTGTLNINELKFFKTKEEAIDWLKK